MFASWLLRFADGSPALARLEYASVRAALAALTAFIISLVVGNWMIRAFSKSGVIEDTSQPDHAGLDAMQRMKKNVPTMGGLMIIAAIGVATFFWADVGMRRIVTGLLCVCVLGALGYIDDTIKLRVKPKRGLSKSQKLVVQFALGLFVGWALVHYRMMGDKTTTFFIPLADIQIDFGNWYILWAAVLLAASSNAVNLADGLDGLAGGCTAIAAAAFAGLALLPITGAGLHIPAGSAETGVFAAAVVGGTLGFLWYNAHPAQIFMGDTGSLMLGGVLGYLALVLKLDLILLLIGIVFFVDEATVALQIAGYKLTKKRIFPIAPIHHYFQVHLKWPEQKISARLWIIGGMAAVAAVAAARIK